MTSAALLDDISIGAGSSRTSQATLVARIFQLALGQGQMRSYSGVAAGEPEE